MQAVVHLECPVSSTGRLIGPGGTTISALRREAGAQIDLIGTTITISGAASAVEAARNRVQAFIGAGGGDAARRAAPCTLEVACPRALVGRLIGPSGSTVKAIQEATGTRVDVQSSGAAGGAADLATVRVLVCGPTPESVEAARARIDGITAQHPAITVRCPAENLGLLIGPGGSNIKAIQRDTGCRVDARDDGGGGVVAISGPSQEAVEAARVRVEAAVNPQTARVEIPANAVRRIIGPGGATISQLRRDTGAQVEVRGTTVSVSGASAAAIADAVRRVQALAFPPTLQLLCPRDLVGQLIGPGGATVKGIQAATGATVDVQGETVSVSGPSREAVLAAKVRARRPLGGGVRDAAALLLRFRRFLFVLSQRRERRRRGRCHDSSVEQNATATAAAPPTRS
jgi:polyribonucleotide nucleotidyltransferase